MWDTKLPPPGPSPRPQRYEIIVDGQIDPHWAAWFDGLALELLPRANAPAGVHTRQSDRTRISGSLADQAALRGVLERIFDLNLTLLSVRRVDEPEQRPRIGQ